MLMSVKNENAAGGESIVLERPEAGTALWWGLSHWLDQTLLTLLPGAVK